MEPRGQGSVSTRGQEVEGVCSSPVEGRKEIGSSYLENQDQLAYTGPPGLSLGETAKAPHSWVSGEQDQCSWSLEDHLALGLVPLEH